MKVLVVDDCPLTRELVRDILEMSGHEVLEADSAEAALGLLAESAVDALVADIVLPGRNGIWLVGEVRARGLARHVVSMSGGGRIGGVDALEAARIAGAHVSLRKPFSATLLMEAVAAAQSSRATAG